MNLAAVAGLPAIPVTSVWYRAIKPGHLATALKYSHTHLFPSRYYEGPTAATPFNIFYLAENPLLARLEVGAMFGSPSEPGGLIANPAGSWLILNAEVRLTRVADLTNVRGSHEALSTTAQELTGDWRGYRQRSAQTSVSSPCGVSPTQELGAALFSSGLFEGFLAISAKLPYQRILGIFPRKLSEAGFVRYRYEDAAGQMQIHEIP